MAASDLIQFTKEEGKDSGHALTVYALSTCGFCKRALVYLKERGAAFRYVYIDRLPPDVKEELKTELRGKFQRTLVYPFLVVDDKEALTGFNQEKWDAFLV